LTALPPLPLHFRHPEWVTLLQTVFLEAVMSRMQTKTQDVNPSNVTKADLELLDARLRAFVQEQVVIQLRWMLGVLFSIVSLVLALVAAFKFLA
jgi:hypothetical protein